MGLTNVRFLEGKRKEDLASYYESADLGIVSLKKHPLFEITIPSKIFDYMSVSLPVLIGVEGEAKEIVEANGAGFPFEPENADDFIRALKLAQSQPERLLTMKKDCAATCFSRLTGKRRQRSCLMLFKSCRNDRYLPKWTF